MEINHGTYSPNRLIRHLSHELKRNPRDTTLIEQKRALEATRSLAKLLGSHKGRQGDQITVILPAGKPKHRERVKVQVGKPLTDQRQTYCVTLNMQECWQRETVELVGYGRKKVDIRFKLIQPKDLEELRFRPTIGTRIRLRLFKLFSLQADSERDRNYIRKKLARRKLLHWRDC